MKLESYCKKYCKEYTGREIHYLPSHLTNNNIKKEECLCKHVGLEGYADFDRYFKNADTKQLQKCPYYDKMLIIKDLINL